MHKSNLEQVTDAGGLSIANLSFHVALPTFVGASIYLLFRTSSLFVFEWVKAIGLYPHLMALRKLLGGVQLPEWFLYSVPDGLWVYATTMWMLIIWRGATPWPWLVIGLFLAIGAELGQAVGYVPGTYQHLDMLFYVAAFVLAFLQKRWFDETAPSLGIGDLGDDSACVR